MILKKWSTLLMNNNQIFYKKLNIEINDSRLNANDNSISIKGNNNSKVATTEKDNINTNKVEGSGRDIDSLIINDKMIAVQRLSHSSTWIFSNVEIKMNTNSIIFLSYYVDSNLK